mmetsp:Transcript_11574/g.12724  ORF Transcript_11574/g.12724 Transcript_11574/m.12724 type:complete len:86 (+) Transcript_11574:117-374(+)
MSKKPVLKLMTGNDEDTLLLFMGYRIKKWERNKQQGTTTTTNNSESAIERYEIINNNTKAIPEDSMSVDNDSDSNDDDASDLTEI